MDVEILSGGLDGVVAEHFFDLIEGCAGLQEILSVCMAQPIGR